MHEFCAKNSGEARDSDHRKGVGIHAPAVEIGLQDVGGGDQRQRHHHAKRWNL